MLKSFQPPYYQSICFAAKLSKQDFIAADAIAKLRQVFCNISCLQSMFNMFVYFLWRKIHTQ